MPYSIINTPQYDKSTKCFGNVLHILIVLEPILGSPTSAIYFITRKNTSIQINLHSNFNSSDNIHWYCPVPGNPCHIASSG